MLIRGIIIFLSQRFVPFLLCQHCYHVDKGDQHVDKGNPRVASEWLRLHLSKVCLNHNPVLFSFMTNSLCCNTSNTTCVPVIKKLRTLREHPSSSCFCMPRVVLFLAIVLSVLLWNTASDYPFGIFKFLQLKLEQNDGYLFEIKGPKIIPAVCFIYISHSC